MYRRTTEQYRFIVEGDTEKWYLEHLQSLISCSDSQNKVKFSITVDSTRYESIIKSCPATVQTDYFVFRDVESQADDDIRTFETSLKKISKANKIRPGIRLILGYSNLFFEVWLLLHFTCFRKPENHACSYLKDLNRFFGLNCESIRAFKTDTVFHQALSRIGLKEIQVACKNARELDAWNVRSNCASKVSSIKYFKYNPSTSVHLIILKILKDNDFSI